MLNLSVAKRKLSDKVSDIKTVGKWCKFILDRFADIQHFAVGKMGKQELIVVNVFHAFPNYPGGR